MKKLISILLLIPTTFVACNKNSDPEIILHDPISFGEFQVQLDDLNCEKGNYGFISCKDFNFEEDYDCMMTSQPEKLIGLGLKQPIFECIFQKRDFSNDDGIVSKGCMLPAYTKFLVFNGEDFDEYKTQDEFAKLVGNIDSKEKALSYLLSVTDAYPMYDFDIPGDYRVYVDTLEATHVVEEDDKYIVNLFEYGDCGCGPHPYFAIEYRLEKDGSVWEQNREKIYENPMDDGLCVD